MDSCRLPFAGRVLLLFTFCFISVAGQSQDVLTYHNNNLRNGWTSAEKILTPANVNAASFGKLFIVPADGRVDAQPLYLSAITISGVSHNLLIVARNTTACMPMMLTQVQSSGTSPR